MSKATDEDPKGILPKIEPAVPVTVAYENQPPRASSPDDCVSSNKDASNDETMQPYDDAVESPFDPKQWLIHDISSDKRRAPRQNEFLYLLLENRRYCSYLSWLDRGTGLFKIHQPDRVVQLWVRVKNRQTHGTMDYDTFARGLRYYYQIGSMIKTHRKYTFRFRLS